MLAHQAAIPDILDMGGTRASILRAAADIYARFGYQGATTRRIASWAAVNEVTLFRHFSSKEELIAEAVLGLGTSRISIALPSLPRSPRAELREWCVRVFADLADQKLMLARSVADAESRPELSGVFDEQARHLAAALRAYLVEVAPASPVPQNAARTAALMLAATLLLETLATDLKADGSSLDDCVDAVLRLIGHDAEPGSSEDDDATGAMESADGVP